ncbi:hypothetical protein BDV12DRAFT_168403 [Aspergillus spectabilis]
MVHILRERPFSSVHHLLKMLLSSHHSKPTDQASDLAEDVDEPPDHRLLESPVAMDDGVIYVKASANMTDRKESLLTRALKSSPALTPTDQHEQTFYRSYSYGNISGISTAELTSDGGLTSPSLSHTSSPPLPSRMANKPPPASNSGKESGANNGESALEANLGRKRCISFACGRKAEQAPMPRMEPSAQAAPIELKRKTTLTFVCPARSPETLRERSPIQGGSLRSRPRGSPAPVARKASPEKGVRPAIIIPQELIVPEPQRGVPTRGLGKFEDSEATRFHEFGSSFEEDAEWVTRSSEYKEKITLNDCMKKEIAIRKIAEEAEEEALEEEDDDVDLPDDSSTLHDFSSDEDDGNESDNEAGFAESDDESNDGSEYEFWAPASTTAATSPLDPPRFAFSRRDSAMSFDSVSEDHPRRNWPPALSGKGNGRPIKIPRMRPGTPDLPDSTDFVCGTLDEDRPLEAAYKSCLEQRRLSKQVVIPQDIDPSFPTSDIEEDDDGEDEQVQGSTLLDEGPRGRSGGEQSCRVSPHPSPKRMISPPPRRQGRASPRRLRSPPPPMKLKPAGKDEKSMDGAVTFHHGLNISELVQRPTMTRTKSLPRTPNPFFTMEHSYQWSGIVPIQESHERESSRTRETYTRGPIDIVEGLEKKRQKRKEKFWRQHCRKAAKEQMERRPAPGRGAERMKHLGLEVAERTRAFGVGESSQLVLSV